MIVKRLREKKHWSQEQLAEISGLSLRTIQRVEAGNRASVETMKSLAAALEVEVSKLAEEIVVIEKDTDSWRTEPLWVRFFLLGIRRRSHFLALEVFLIVIALVSWALNPTSLATPMIFLFPYLNAKLLAYIDQKAYW